MRLISALFDAARGRSDFKIILYLFDGVVVRSTDASKTAWMKRLQTAFNERAKELGVETTLSIGLIGDASSASQRAASPDSLPQAA